ncbi:MAG: hypothetical protein R6X25_14140 [Candidatus Krumholzibacteriia bacterium]
MEKCTRWVTRHVRCPENPVFIASLLVERDGTNGRLILHSISCDNPRLTGDDDWECRWRCWDRIRENPLV